MKSSEMIAIAAIAIVVILIFYFIIAKGPTKKLTITNPDASSVSVDAEIADNMTTRAKGLMGRKSLGENEGMLFVFDSAGRHSFWMVNTSISLDGIFIDSNGTVVDIIAMEPCGLNILNCPRYTPKADAKYVLEVNQGFAEKNKIAIGKSRLKLPIK
ncbi:MAG: DUF192 domain-containing protein [Candidatus ainarchaeum sp.]|nr:DUF192 domain-containing protein [Candidatus ainarchaeum sp.]